MTYLDLVNQVLVRLREDTVSSVSSGVEGPLISALVTDAYKIVEDAHDWSVLRNDVEVALESGTATYTLTGVPVDSMIYFAYIDGSRFLQRVSKEWYARRQSFGTPSPSEPNYFFLSGADGATQDLKLTVFPTPDQSYTLTVNAAVRGTGPTNDADNVILPIEPIRYLALAFATRERGETGGSSAQEYFALAETSLAQAIARDANQRPDEITLYVV